MPRLPKPNTLTPSSLRRIIARGETEQVEFKGRRARLQDISSAVVCLANGAGGLVLWGVDDDGQPSGTSLRDADSVPRSVYHNTSPSQVVPHQVVELDGHGVIAIWISHSPVLVSTSGGAYLQRVGTECLPMTPDRLIVRQIDTRALDFSSALTPVPSTMSDETQVERYRQLLPAEGPGAGLARMPTSRLLQAIGASHVSDGAELLTVAGLLLFGSAAVIRGVVPQHQVLYLRTPGGTTDYDRRVVASVGLLQLVDDLVREIQAASRIRRLRLGMRDLELPDYPETVLREAMVNAIAHRHYTLPGDTVIRQTTRHVDIENPGGFPEGITVETVIQHAPVHRNRLLCEILDRIRWMERSGLGVDRIFQDQLRYGKRPPTYDADRTAVRLRLDASEFDEAFARFVLAEEESGRDWTVEELLVASHLRRMGPADRFTLAKVMQRPEDEASEIIGTLSGTILERFGSGPGTRYVLGARVQAALGAEATFTRERGLAKEYQRGLVLQHAYRFGRVDNRTVRDLLQISTTDATNLLRTLVARGELIQRGERRWAVYEPRPAGDVG